MRHTNNIYLKKTEILKEQITPEVLVKTCRLKGMPIFCNNGSKYLNHNLFFIRMYEGGKPTNSGWFDDLEGSFFQHENGVWDMVIFNCSTDAGSHWFKNPIKKDGTVGICEGFHSRAFKLCGEGTGVRGHGSRRSRGLRQVKPIWTVRDNTKDLVVDYIADANDPEKAKELINSGVLEMRFASTNIHDTVGKYTFDTPCTKQSQGCIVTPKGKHFDDYWMMLFESLKGFSNEFSLKGINSDDIKETLKRI